MSMFGGLRPIGLLAIPIMCASAFVLLLLLNISTANGKCGSPPNWIPWPTTAEKYVSIIYNNTTVITCLATNPNGYPVPGTVVSQQVMQPNGTTYNITYCAAASPYHANFNSTTFKVLRLPLPSEGDRVVCIPIHNPALGLRSMKEPHCAVTADEGNISLVDPNSGRLYVGLPSGIRSIYQPGSYVQGVGIRNAWMMHGPWNNQVYLVAIKKVLVTPSKMKENSFACYEGVRPTGTPLRNFTVVGSMTNCMMACLNNVNCTIVTTPALLTTTPSTSSGTNIYGHLSARSKLFLRVPLECQLFQMGFFVESTDATNLTVCTKLVE